MVQMTDLCKKSIAVLGFGRSGRAVTDVALREGGRVHVYCEAPVAEEVAAPYLARGVRFFTGAFPSCFPEELLVRSPGIRPDIPAILASLAGGATLTGEAELFLERCPAQVIGVTGSDGKTTTSALIAALLSGGAPGGMPAGRRVLYGGNNGHPLLPQVGELRAGDLAVLELSSFQLMTLRHFPGTAVITNITPNHLNWHRDLSEYIAAKSRILAGARRLITNADCPVTAALAHEAHCETVLFSASPEAPSCPPPAGGAGRVSLCGSEICLQDATGEQRFPLAAYHLPGRHNLENLMAALAAAAPYLCPGTVPDTLAAFRVPTHRLQYVATVQGVAYYNSSIDTSPTRTEAALQALGGTPLVIAGGRGKGLALQPLADTLAAHARAVFLYGETAGELLSALHGRCPAHAFCTFRKAFAAAAAAAEPGDTVLLSPGCTAFGEFRDFEERGEVFMQLVAALPQKGTT